MKRPWLGILLAVLVGTAACSRGKRDKCARGFDQMKEIRVSMARAFLQGDDDSARKLDTLGAELDAERKDFLDLCETLPAEAVACLASPLSSMTEPHCQDVLGKLDLGGRSLPFGMTPSASP
ncbi:MAG: hypothetical protein IT373_21570 [Polyangiaceae bacterium]|nr:hypothetical protein [Polyangiaceae bacterium]